MLCLRVRHLGVREAVEAPIQQGEHTVPELITGPFLRRCFVRWSYTCKIVFCWVLSMNRLTTSIVTLQ
jgi:hypothetical protein